MSRCHPYPPPGYEKKAAQPVAEIIPAPQAPRKEKHKHKEKDKDKKKKRKRDDDAKDDNAHKEKRSSKNQKAGAAVHSAENGRIPEANAAAAAKPVEAAQVEREGNGAGVSSLQEGRSPRIFSSERDAGKAGSRVSVSSTGKPSSSSSSGKGEAQEHRINNNNNNNKVARDGAQAALSRTGLEPKPSKDAKASSSFDARTPAGKDAAVSRPRDEAKASVSRNDVRGSSASRSDVRGSEAKVSVSRNDVRSSDAPASASRNSAVPAQEAKASVSRIGEPASEKPKSESRKHGSEKKKRDHDKASSSKALEINGRVSPLIAPKPLDTGQAEQQQQQQPVQQVVAKEEAIQQQQQHQQQQQPQQQQQQQQQAERIPEPKLKRLKLPEIAAEPGYGDDYLEWLVSGKKKPAPAPAPVSGTGEEKRSSEEQRVWADALYLPAVDLYALPYVVPH